MTGVVALGDVAEFIRGVTYKPTDVTHAGDPDAIACMRTKNIQRDLEDGDLVYIPASPILRQKRLRSGDILVSSANSWNLVGKCAWVPRLAYDATFGGFTSVLRTMTSTVDARYLYHWFSTDRIQQTARSFGQQTTNISNLNHKRCLELEIPLPLLAEQRRIAAILDKADALRRQRRRALALLDGLTQSIFLEMFGDPDRNPHGYPVDELANLATFFSGGSLPSGDVFAGQADGFLLLKVSDLNLPGNEDTIRSAMTWRPQPGTKAETCEHQAIVFPKRGGAIATNKKRKLTRPAILDPNLMAVAPDQRRLLLDYTYGWFRRLRLEDISSGSSVPQLNKQDLAPLRIAVPPLERQKQFSTRCSATAAATTQLRISESAIEALFLSLQRRAFSGGL